ncbi:hypothetical protein PEL8287_02469 [Roseovarius litorisediminis]|uniref:Uncharacterized protein n=1 Tax=Roseovarius litorisediminis TaxID=1312363 RepID=A0A1Y5STQ1_9RHOB|nr:hypothetical protein [Roseovarius litorisediminis]SLN47878.1 hypothetical protein PEL8287_02469 [Roseovarius litorisediminis]
MDVIAVYGAVLSTFLAIVGLWNWWMREIYLTVHGIHQFENWLGSDAFAFAIANSGRRATIVRKVKVEFFEGKGASTGKLGEAIFDHSTRFNPATKDVPVDGKPNTSKREPNVIQPGDEIHGMAHPISEYRPDKHWIKVTALARGTNREFSHWIVPQKRKEKE